MDSLTKKRRRKKKKDVNDERRKVGHNDFNTKLCAKGINSGATEDDLN